MLLLIEHPHFVLHQIGASSRSARKKYGGCSALAADENVARKYRDPIVKPCEPEEFKDCDIVFSGLDSSVAGEIEMGFLKAECKELPSGSSCPIGSADGESGSF